MKLDRLLIESLENRILVGIATFVGIMVIIGWIGINEPARMATFQDQYQGRSIERGAYLFNQNCSTCHAVDGRGLMGRAPGLNNPHLFGYDYLASERRQIEGFEIEIANQEAILAEYEDLSTQVLEGELGEEALAEAEARLEELEPLLAEAEAEIADLEAQIAEVETQIEGQLAQMAPAIENNYDPDNPRLTQVGWEGSLESYVLTTLVHGRPGSANYWPASGGGMAAWGQVAGGPLREDQLQDLTNYILNWDKGGDWTMDDLNAVNQFARLPVEESDLAVAAESEGEPIGTDVDTILAELPDYTGDPNNGQTIYNGMYACAGCHGQAVVAPLTENQWADVVAGNGGRPYSDEPERYFVESIVNPGAFVVEGYPAGAMPANFGQNITHQQLADILAYIQSYD